MEKTTILLSIKPEYVEKIFNGTKAWEYRRKIWKNNTINNINVDRVVIYETAPVSKVVGVFLVGAILRMPPEILYTLTSYYSGIERDKFLDYFKGLDTGIGIEIVDPIRYETPRPLSEYGIKRPPQSFMYLGPREGNENAN